MVSGRLNICQTGLDTIRKWTRICNAQRQVHLLCQNAVLIAL